MSNPIPHSDNAAYLARMAGHEAELPATPKSVNAQYLAEVVQRLESLSHIGRYLSTWNCTTGLPATNPQTLPYSYHTGDYFIVGAIAAAGGTNYKPNGTSYSGAASTTTDASTIAVGDMYRFDGTTWELLKFSLALQNKQDKSKQVTEGTNITLEDNTEYRLTNVSTLTIAYPSGNFECWLKITTAASGTVAITLPTSRYIGSVPTFANSETWEISVKDGVVGAVKVGDAQ